MSNAIDVGCDADDRFLWLEEITGEEALTWVRQHNKPTLAELGNHRFEAMRAEALEVYEADTQIPPVGRAGEHLYNFWRDAMHTRGVWRRTTLEEYQKDSPEWDVLIDVDALAAEEGMRPAHVDPLS